MNVATLSLPLEWNVGGILQQYALKTTLQQLGHKVTILSRKRNCGWRQQANERLKQKALHAINALGVPYSARSLPVESFKRLYLKELVSTCFSSTCLSKRIQKHNIEAVVVGSDQVWNPQYCPDLPDFFLAFSVDPSILKVAYAASFGHSTIEVANINLPLLSRQLQGFNAVSVREESGVEICSKVFSCHTAQHVPDPTVLLQKGDYLALAKASSKLTDDKSPYLFVYILDLEDRVIDLIRRYSQALHLRVVFHFRDHSDIYNHASAKTDGFFRSTHSGGSVEAWIQSVSQAQLVLTDSFHGTLFSCVLNTPFYTLCNAKRGKDRFISLLTQLNLSSRLIQEHANSLKLDGIGETDWDSVNRSLEQARQTGLNYLVRVLSGN